MASQTSKADKAIPTLDEFGRDIARRRAEAAAADPPRNTGARRTPSKKALLAAIAETGKRW